MVSLNHYLLLSAVLFTLGVLGVMARKNALVILMSVELMLNAANLAIVAFIRYAPPLGGDAGLAYLQMAGNGMVFVFLILTVSAAEVGVGLAVVINLFRQRETVNIEIANLLKG
ncbi:MAG TPA: NADH-quinone oxidoreductase subunit NuoK [bacterium]|nr:NADH-quinone oxidoreductase subunit NuoK [Candidatus Omnitrophota bacterium]HOJ60414.1 NADH-quinone oxidoreductase subunit NuoK [bacterium]HOL94091.1 NADH-quinone oxidoreductase subunit NuoK [bacterium]HPP02419.1 NADH-quinone oxidoreductase subunit NuoK [bacterium]HXK95745.1 NADH-quinone oxidoreductase subunit NuoK [bacterium]